MAANKPLLVYDGDCRFCRGWVERWRGVARDRVDFAPYQTAAERFPHVKIERFQEAVQLFEGTAHYSGAEAVFRVLGYAPFHGHWLKLYKAFPPFARAADLGYAFIASRRPLFSRITRWLWGDDPEPSSYFLGRRVFLAGLGLSYFAAFFSLYLQVPGLFGDSGIAPVAKYLQAAQAQLGSSASWALPTLLWHNPSAGFLHRLCAAGAALSIPAALGIASGPILALLWALFLSVLNVGQAFLSFQWDILLLEAGFLAIFLAPWTLWTRRKGEPPPSSAFLFLLRFLLFRLMFESGCVKLLSHDLTWRNLTALYYHYETQPLPTVFGWYAHQLPHWFQRASAAFMFAVELGAPLLIFAPRRPRTLACAALVSLQLLIALTGNYCFFNLLTISLCFLTVDDQTLRAFLPARFRGLGQDPPREPRVSWRTVAAVPVGAVSFGLGSLILANILGLRPRIPSPVAEAFEAAQPFHLVSGYGLFANMTHPREEIVVQGSDDGREWTDYSFKWKPGSLDRAPRWVAPLQPRLDWQMWFAALSDYRHEPWFVNFIVRLLQGSPPVLDLLDRNPFPEKPPRYVRALIYEYHFTTWSERRETGAWWKRGEPRLYFPPATLK